MYQRTILPTLKKYLHTPETVVITGMRRVGKTTLLRQLYDELAQEENKLFFDLENPLNRKYFEAVDYERVMVALSALGLDPQKRAWIFLDEVQYMRELPSVVKYISDHYPVKFFLTGSASFYLKHLFAESLAGRKRLFELYPLSFLEYLQFQEEAVILPKNRLREESVYLRLQGLYGDYVRYGAFPQVALAKTAKARGEILEDIFTSYFNKEVLELGDFRKNQVMRDLMLLLLERVGSKVDVQKLAKELKVSRLTIQEYLAFLEGTYMFAFVRPFSRSRDVEIRSTPKVYCIDSGLAGHIGAASKGAVFENAIFHQLRLHAKQLNYFQKKSGVEIDFIVDKKTAYEVKTQADRSDYNSLQRVRAEIKMDRAALVSYQWVPDVPVIYGWQL